MTLPGQCDVPHHDDFTICVLHEVFELVPERVASVSHDGAEPASFATESSEAQLVEQHPFSEDGEVVGPQVSLKIEGGQVNLVLECLHLDLQHIFTVLQLILQI